MRDPVDLDSVRPEPITVYGDTRGALWKAMAASGPGACSSFGELYVVHSCKGAVRGNHYHRSTTEWFLVVQGKGTLRLAIPGEPQTGEPQAGEPEKREYLLDASHPAVLKIPPGIAHRFIAEAEGTTILLAVADREYDENAPDTVPHTL